MVPYMLFTHTTSRRAFERMGLAAEHQWTGTKNFMELANILIKGKG